MNQSLFNRLKWPVGAVLLFLVINAIYFSPQLGGKNLRMSDIDSFKGMYQETKQYKEETGKTALWTNSIFSGMPTYQIGAPQTNNLLMHVHKAFRLFIPPPIGFFFAAMLSFYILMISLGAKQEISILGAIAFGLTTNNLVLLETGHTSKMMAIVYTPLVIAGLINAFNNKLLLGGGLFALGMGLNVLVNHPQMTYYLLICFLFYGFFELYRHIKSKELNKFLKASAVLILALVLALASSGSKLWTTYEYSKDTMRGEPILMVKSSKDATSSSETKGLAYDYAMQWSNGISDLAASIVPRAAGGSGGEVVKNSAAIAALKKKGANVPADTPEPLYHGALPFTSGPAYFGAIICFLFVFSCFVVKGPIKWFLLASTILTLLLSMGKNCDALTSFFFNYVPLYNKFRAPSSILSVTAVFLPILGYLGLSKIVKGDVEKKQVIKAVFWALGITGGLCALIAFVGPSMMDLNANSDASYQQRGWDIEGLKKDRASAIMGDGIRSLLFILLAAGAIWAWAKSKIKALPMLLIVGVLSIIDIWGIGKRYITSEDFLEDKVTTQSTQPRPVDQQILLDKDLHYRVHDITPSNPWSSTTAAYFHKMIGGYHAAKLQRYQDFIDRYLAKNDMNAMNMLNTKYFIVPGQDGQPSVQQNRDAYGNAWFVGNLKFVETPEDEIAQIGTTDLKQTAIVLNTFSDQLPTTQFTPNGSINLTSYAPDELSYKSNSTGDQFAVFSEVWYGPDKGWNAYIDGEKAPHVRVNYLLRGLNIPAGEHEIRFAFEPRSYRLGEILSLIASLIILGFIGYSVFLAFKQKGEVEVNAPKLKEPTTKSKSTVSKRGKKKKK